MFFGFFPVLGLTELFLVLATGIFIVWPVWRICSKAGFPGALGLLSLFPLLNVVLLFFLAFAEWPALRKGKSPFDRDF